MDNETGSNLSFAAWMASPAGRITRIVAGAALIGAVPGVGWSDHWSFWECGYDAIMVTDTAPFRYLHYHEATDTPDRLRYDSLALIVEALVPVIEELAGQP